MSKESKKAASKKWAENNKEKLAAYAKEYNQRPEVKAKMKAYNAKSYQKNRAKRDAANAAYKAAHLDRVNELARVGNWTRAGKVAPAKTFSFYRDAVRKWIMDPVANKDNIEFVLSLDLTARQRQIANLTFSGLNTVEIQILLKFKSSSNVIKVWNGNNKNGRKQGGIYNKWKKAKNIF